MDRAEMKALIAAGVPASPGTWADLGAGGGNFTWALAELLAHGSTIYAVDRDARALQRVGAQHDRVPGVTVQTHTADVTQLFDLPPLDGILMANVLHWVQPQAQVLERCLARLVPGGRLILVEYEIDGATSWVPVPVPSRRFTRLAVRAGFATPIPLGTRRSPTNNTAMYAAVAHKPGP